jgi:hypothetical protein
MCPARTFGGLSGLGQMGNDDSSSINNPTFNNTVNQALALFIKAVRKLFSTLQTIQRDSVAGSLPQKSAEDVVRKVAPLSAGGVEGEGDVGTSDWKPMRKMVAEDLEEAGTEESRRMKEMQREMIDSMDLSQYVVLASLASSRDLCFFPSTEVC